MLIKPKDWYSEDYFYPNTRHYTDQYGVTREYKGPSKDWNGFSYIANFIKDNFIGVETINDIGCSAGAFVARSIEMGFKTKGCDISDFAINNCLEGARGHVVEVDITKYESMKKSDMVVSFDLMEHIYEKDLNDALAFITGSCKSGGWIFLCIATARNQNEIWSHPDEDTIVPPDRTWLAVSGHVHIRTIDWWIKKLESCGFTTNYEKMMHFHLWRARHSTMRDVESWGIGNVYIGRL